jgi:hypothetical protein
VWGSPVTNTEGLTASPAHPGDSPEQQTLPTDTHSEREGSTDTSPSSKETEDKTTASSAVSRAEIEQLRDRIAFVRAMFERTDSDDVTSELIVGVTAQVEDTCEDLLEH